MPLKCIITVAATLLLLPGISPVSAQDRPAIVRLKLEELLATKITSVSRKEQALGDAPAAIYVITSDAIRRSGASSIPDLLRDVPGVQVARYSNSKWAVSARGFGSYYSNKLLVLVDGRSVFTADFSGVQWNLLDLMLEDVERIEIVRGPGGAMWGANAVNGVINIITKHTTATTGILATARTGTEDRGVGAVRFGGAFGARSGYRAYIKAADRRLDAPAAGVRDTARTVRGGFRFDLAPGRDEWLVQSDVFRTEEETPFSEPITTPPYSRVLADGVHSTGAHVLTRWTRTLADGDRLAVQGYVDRDARSAYVQTVTSHTYDVDFQYRMRVARRHDLMWGSGFRHRATETSSTDLLRFEPGAVGRRLLSAFVQDEVELGTAVTLTAGAKVEHYQAVSAAIQPSARIMWTPRTSHSLWAALSRSVRTPSLADQYATLRYKVFPGTSQSSWLPVAVDVVGGIRDKALERVVAAEVGYRAQPHAAVAFDLTGFRNDYDRLTSYERTPPVLNTAGGVPHLLIRSHTADDAAGYSYGLEAAARWHAAPWWTLTGSATLLDVNLHITDPTIAAGDSLLVQLMNPRTQVAIRSAVDLPAGVDLDVSVARMGPWQATGVEGYSRADVRGGWTSPGRVRIDAGVQNLLRARHTETSVYLWYVPVEIPRAAYVRLTVGL